MNILVIDIGTSSMLGILFDMDGRKLAAHQVKYQPVKYPDGRIEQPPSHWTVSAEEICRIISEEAGSRGSGVDALAITAQRSAIIPVDRDGMPLMDTIMWQDRRNGPICRELETYNQLIFETSGAAVNTVFSGSRMAWIARNCPEIMDRLYKYVNIPEYVIHYITGQYRTDATYGSRTHLMNLRERRWDPRMLELFGIREEQLCVLQEPGAVVGTVQADFAARTGLTEGTPVVSAGGDQQCAAIGQGAYSQGTLSIVAGTGGFLVTAVDRAPDNLSPRLICNCSSVRGGYMIEANVLTCCSAFDWFCRNFYDWDGDQICYGKINQDLQDLEGQVAGPLALPYFQGRSTPEWNPEARAVFGEISLNTSRKELLKGLVEGICLEIRNNIQLFSEYTQVRQAYISGGLTNSHVINQLQADIYGIELYHMEDSESTALGALMVALAGLGVYPDLDRAFKVIRGRGEAQRYRPRAALHMEYEKKRARMNQMYRKLYD